MASKHTRVGLHRRKVANALDLDNQARDQYHRERTISVTRASGIACPPSLTIPRDPNTRCACHQDRAGIDSTLRPPRDQADLRAPLLRCSWPPLHRRAHTALVWWLVLEPPYAVAESSSSSLSSSHTCAEVESQNSYTLFEQQSSLLERDHIAAFVVVVRGGYQH